LLLVVDTQDAPSGESLPHERTAGTSTRPLKRVGREDTSTWFGSAGEVIWSVVKIAGLECYRNHLGGLLSQLLRWSVVAIAGLECLRNRWLSVVAIGWLGRYGNR
jgi:hypothetical protein